MKQQEICNMKALNLFKELTPIYDYEPYISFECGKWCVCWIDSEGDVLTQFLEEDLAVAIQQAYEWFKNRE